MIHSMSGGVLRNVQGYIYVFVAYKDVFGEEVKRWFISPTASIKAGDRVEIPVRNATAAGEVLRVENVTEQTAPFPVKRTAEIVRVL